MKSFKRLAVLLLALSTFAISALADDTLTPQEIVQSTVDDYTVVEKIYVLPKDSDASLIPTESYTENEVEYEYVETKVHDNSEEDTKEHVENISYHTSTNDAEAVIALFAPTAEITTEDGYFGILTFDHSTLELTPAGYSSRKFTVTEERSYPNLASADTSLVPKTIDKDGTTLTLANIEWVTAADETISGTDVAIRYTANAIYTGTETKTYVNGYTASADYKGTVTKVINDTVTYTAVFKENKETNEPMIDIDKTNDKKDTSAEKKAKTAGIVAGSVAGAAALGAGGYAIYRLIRKKRKGY